MKCWHEPEQCIRLCSGHCIPREAGIWVQPWASALPDDNMECENGQRFCIFPVAFQFSFWTAETRGIPELNASDSCVCLLMFFRGGVKIPFLQLVLTWRNPFLSGIAVVGEALLHVSASSQLFASLGRYSE